MKRIIPALFLCLIARQVSAGDAIAMGYDYDGVWTAVTYFRSSTPKDGHHYWNAAQACIFARRDLHIRASEDLARTKIIGQSDRTGYVTVAHGTVVDANNGVTTIGRGKSQNEADENALKQLNERKATADERVVYRYFSYGTDAGTGPTNRHTRHPG
jgi:hypothetical protein